jgi:hypothetical protein
MQRVAEKTSCLGWRMNSCRAENNDSSPAGQVMASGGRMIKIVKEKELSVED